MTSSIGRFAILFGISLGFIGGASAKELRPFRTDGCSYWADGSIEQPKLWLHCCIGHDLDLWGGGTKAQHDEADLRLRDCVAATGADEEAKVIYMGVRIGTHWPHKINGMQWGNAWDAHAVRTTKLSTPEINQLLKEVDRPIYDSVIPDAQRKDYVTRLRAQRAELRRLRYGK